MTSPATDLPTARALVDAPSEATPLGSAAVYPVVLLFSLVLHGAVLAAVMLVPVESLDVTVTAVELAFVPVEAPPPPPPEPEPEPEVAPPEPAAMVPPPETAPRRERRVAEPPAPPAPVLTAAPGTEGADWGTDPGEEGGRLGGTPGGTGTGTGGPASEAAPEAAPVRTGPSRAELRRRVMSYIRGLSGSLTGRVGYPLAARRDHLEGIVVLHLRLSTEGRVLGVRMARSSGHEVLDAAALASVGAVDALPAPPEGVPWDEARELPVPIRFRLQ
ncbi:MAG: energy transducer TonB [Sandaracinaceae bacterium]|nr:energy transducer TonB [Sandaracinaceae bacterium]